MYKTFGLWLIGQLQARDIRKADLARASGLDATMIGKFINGSQNPGPEDCQAISRALDIPLQEVYRATGVLTDEGAVDPVMQAVNLILINMDQEDREAVLTFARERRKQLYKKLGVIPYHRIPMREQNSLYTI